MQSTFYESLVTSYQFIRNSRCFQLRSFQPPFLAINEAVLSYVPPCFPFLFLFFFQVFLLEGKANQHYDTRCDLVNFIRV